ncbi:MAG: hypothetical protein IPF60_16185 [Betaproteobacteria bacterium]|nr:hypothetical protein [Betaproteobacteria bacterium]
MIVLDDSGGESITSFDDDEAVALFLDWLADAREREAARWAQHALEAVTDEREAEVAVRRAAASSP